MKFLKGFICGVVGLWVLVGVIWGVWVAGHFVLSVFSEPVAGMIIVSIVWGFAGGMAALDNGRCPL